jgi:cytochrome c-type biogenesis protein CcmH
MPLRASAQSPQDVANRVATKIMSPYCPGVTLHDCPSDQALQLRRRIVGWAAAGLTEQQIIARLIDEFGPSIRATPSSAGAGVLAWILPSVALLAGTAVAALIVRRWIRSRPTEGLAAEGPSDDERRRLDTELARLRRQA